MFLFRSRRAVAVLGLAAALFLVLPAPSQAAGLWETPSVVVSRVWAWMESLMLVKPTAPLRRMAAPWAKEGSAIDPNGRTVPGTTSTAPPASALSEEGSAIDPDGGRN
jgi:hypothetical protein